MKKSAHWVLAIVLLAAAALPALAGDTHGGGPKAGSGAISMSSFTTTTSASAITLGDASVSSARFNAMTVSDADRAEASLIRSPQPVRSVTLMARLKLYYLIAYTLYDNFFLF